MYGYINRNGAVVIEPKFVEADEFSEGLAAVRVKGPRDSTRRVGNETLVTITGPFGFIDKSGRMVIAPVFSQVSKFSHGLAAINRGNETPDLWNDWAYIDRSGNFIWHPDKMKRRDDRV